MRSSEVRKRVLEDHDGLRGDLDRLEVLTRRVQFDAAGDIEVRSLRGDATSLLERLRTHMGWEERHLFPALRDADAWGNERVQRLVADHLEQRALLDFILERLSDEERPAALLFSDVFGLIAFLREDMEEEERDFLSERLLGDDVIAIDVETG